MPLDNTVKDNTVKDSIIKYLNPDTVHFLSNKIKSLNNNNNILAFVDRLNRKYSSLPLNTRNVQDILLDIDNYCDNLYSSGIITDKNFAESLRIFLIQIAQVPT